MRNEAVRKAIQSTFFASWLKATNQQLNKNVCLLHIAQCMLKPLADFSLLLRGDLYEIDQVFAQSCYVFAMIWS